MSDGEVFRDWNAEYEQVIAEQLSIGEISRAFGRQVSAYVRDNAQQLHYADMADLVFAHMYSPDDADDAAAVYENVWETAAAIVNAVRLKGQTR
jgi:hypothetical protein